MAGHSKSDAHREHYRLFIAVQLPDIVKNAIAQAQSELRAALPAPSIRWTRREQFHLTMRFLGSVDAGDVDRLTAAIRSVCEGSSVLQLRAAGLGVFPGHRRPRVVWTGVSDGEGRLATLQRAIETATAPFTSEAPEERFTGHVTLARCRDIGRGESWTLSALVNRMAGRSFGEWTVSSVDLMRSETLPAGSRYTILASTLLA